MPKDRYVFGNDDSCGPYFTYRNHIEETHGRDRRTSTPTGRLRERQTRSQREPELLPERQQGRVRARERER